MNEERYASIQGGGSVRRIALTNELDAPVDQVWTAITDVDQIHHWWPDWRPGGVIEPREGGAIRLGDGSWIDGTIKVWFPPYIFEFTWHDSVTPEAEWFERNTRSLLRIDLVSLAADKTLLNLVQYSPEPSVVGGTAGWHYFAGERLREFLAAGIVEDRPDRFEQLKALYEDQGST